MKVYPMLRIQSLSVQNIPLFITNNNIYENVKQLKTYVRHYSLKDRIYDNMEITQMYLTHLDYNHYDGTVKLCSIVLMNQHLPSKESTVPMIATTLE